MIRTERQFLPLLVVLVTAQATVLVMHATDHMVIGWFSGPDALGTDAEVALARVGEDACKSLWWGNVMLLLVTFFSISVGVKSVVSQFRRRNEKLDEIFSVVAACALRTATGTLVSGAVLFGYFPKEAGCDVLWLSTFVWGPVTIALPVLASFWCLTNQDKVLRRRDFDLGEDLEDAGFEASEGLAHVPQAPQQITIVDDIRTQEVSGSDSQSWNVG